jgi:hypothetical protein
MADKTKPQEAQLVEPTPAANGHTAEGKSAAGAKPAGPVDWKKLMPKVTQIKVVPVEPDFMIRLDPLYYNSAIVRVVEKVKGAATSDDINAFAHEALKAFVEDRKNRTPSTLEDRQFAEGLAPTPKTQSGTSTVSVKLTEVKGSELAQFLMARYGATDKAKGDCLREALAKAIYAGYQKHFSGEAQA